MIDSPGCAFPQSPSSTQGSNTIGFLKKFSKDESVKNKFEACNYIESEMLITGDEESNDSDGLIEIRESRNKPTIKSESSFDVPTDFRFST